MTNYFLLVALLISNVSIAQHRLQGIVTDDNGLPFQNVLLTIEQTGQSTKSNEEGYYKFENVATGTYALSVDYLYDKQYFTVEVTTGETTFNMQLSRRIEFGEVLVKGYQMDVSDYSNASKFNSEQLQELNREKDLPYVLKGSSAVVVQSDAGNGIGYTGIRIRGMDPSHVQVNINGIPFNDSESSLSYFVDIPDVISQTDELVILKGNVPGRAGTPSFGGAIDINTNKLNFDPFVFLKMQYGSFSSSKYSIQANSGLLDGKFNFKIGLSRQKSDGYIDRSDSDLISFSISGAVIKKNYSIRLNYIHGSERTGQAWNGLPVQYENIDNLRTYNSAGTEKPGSPYVDEKDNYKQDHVQLFYQRQLSKQVILNSSFNYTRGSGYYENYKTSQSLFTYYVNGFDTSIADLVKRQWLQNDFVFTNVGLQIISGKKFVFRPAIGWSYYNGEHFGQVPWVNLNRYNYLRSRYYENTGLKKELSFTLKSEYKASHKLNISLDLHYRKISYDIDGSLEFYDSILIQKKYDLFNPKIFANYMLTRNIHLYASIGLMHREPFRQDLINENQELNPEELFDVEAGVSLKLKSIDIKANGYMMYYKNQLALSGRISDVGEPLRINLDRSYRLGIELESEWRIADWISVWNATNLSANRISKITETIPIYDASYNFLGYKEDVYTNTNISYSPAQVINTGVNITVIKANRSIPEISLQLNHYWVSKFYLDNFSRSSALMEGYQHVDFILKAERSSERWGTIQLWFAINNLFNEKYSSHGWIAREVHEEPLSLSSSPYLGQESSTVYYYKGIFPQALRHFNLGISLRFH